MGPQVTPEQVEMWLQQYPQFAPQIIQAYQAQQGQLSNRGMFPGVGSIGTGQRPSSLGGATSTAQKYKNIAESLDKLFGTGDGADMAKEVIKESAGMTAEDAIAKLFGGTSSGAAGAKAIAAGAPAAPQVVAINGAAPVSAGAGIGGSLGAAGTAGLGTAAALYGAGMYNYGGRQALSGDADAGDYTNLALQANPMTFWVNPALDAVGLGSAGEALGLNRKTGKQMIGDRLKKLEDSGVRVPDSQRRMDDYGASHQELIERAQRTGGNVDFARSRNESDLRPEDTWGGLMWMESLGNDYLEKMSEQERRELNQFALDNDLIEEARGALHWRDKNKAEEAISNYRANRGAGGSSQPQPVQRPTGELFEKPQSEIDLSNIVALADRAVQHQPIRSKTRSPGIGLDGKPIRY